MARLKTLCLDWIFTFGVPVQCRIHNLRVGILFRACQVAVLLGIVLSMYFQDSWTYKEMPLGSVNAWLEYENDLSADDMYHEMLSPPGLPSYCNGASMFAWDDLFKYDNPQCTWMHLLELSIQAKNNLKVITSAMELRETAWVNGSTDDAQNLDLCALRNGTLETDGPQRTCHSMRAIYALGVERLTVALEHFYMANSLDSRINDFRGSSNTPPGEPGAVETTVVGEDGKHYGTFKPGSYIKKSLGEWLQIAGVQSLDSLNPLHKDYRDKSIHAPYRTTGITLDFILSYNNLHHGRPAYLNRRVTAKLYVKLNPLVVGVPATDYSLYPIRDSATGAEIYDKTSKYSMVANFRFRHEGWIYISDWGKVFSKFVAGLVMLQAAQTLAIAYAKWCHPRATMLRNATETRFDVSDRLGVIGLKGALAALELEWMVSGTIKQVNLVQLVSIYGKIENMSFEQAFAAAHLVMELAKNKKNRDSVLRQSWGASLSSLSLESTGEVLPATLDFDSVLSIREGQGIISWQTFLEIAEDQAAPLMVRTDDELRNECFLAYERQQQQQQQQQLSTEVTNCATEKSLGLSDSMQERLEGLVRICSELKASLENHVVRQSRALEDAKEELQAKFEIMFENERDEVRKNIMAMRHVGVNCSKLVNQTVEVSTKLTNAMDQRNTSNSVLQVPVRDTSRANMLDGASKNGGGDLMMMVQPSTKGSLKSSKRSSSTSLPSTGDASVNITHLMKRVLRLEEWVAKLTKEIVGKPGHSVDVDEPYPVAKLTKEVVEKSGHKGTIDKPHPILVEHLPGYGSLPPDTILFASQHSQCPGQASGNIPKPTGIYEDIIETSRPDSQCRSRWRNHKI